MVKKGSTPLDVKPQLHEMVEVVFSGLHEEGGKIKASRRISEFSTRKTYKAMHRLSQEFPEFFPDYFVTDYQDFPHNNGLEDILFDMGALGLLTLCGPRMDIQRVRARTKRVMAIALLKRRCEAEIRKFLPVVKRFNELMAAVN